MFKAIGNWIESRTGYRSVVRHALDEPIPGGARWRYVFGSALSSTFFLQLATGLLLMASYSPSSTTAWGSVFYINNQMTLGWMVRGLHHFGSQAMVILLVLHLGQVLLAGAYRAPRELNWWFGIALLFVTLGFSLTGYLLPWDQKGYWATRVATNIMGGAPRIGPYISKLVVGGSGYGNQTLTRFYALHVGLLPLALIGLLVVHIVLFRRHGVTYPKPTHGRVDKFWPKQVFMDTLAGSVVVAALIGLVFYEGGANLDAPADPSNADYPARPEWYFLSLFQMLKLFPGEYEIIGTTVVPAAILGVLLVLPLLDKVIPSKFAHFLACSLVFAFLGGAGYLTYLAIEEDRTNDKFLADVAASREAADRAKVLASAHQIGPDGARYLLRRDPLHRGREVLEANCLSCHYYDGKGRATVRSYEIPASELAAMGSTMELEGVPEVVSKAALAKVPGLKVESTETTDQGFVIRGTNPADEPVVATVSANGTSVDVVTSTPQKAADLLGYGGRDWLRGLLEDPNADRYFGKVPQCRGMGRWREGTSLTSAELDDVADFFRDLVATVPEDLPASEWETLDKVAEHPGFDAFYRDGECVSCHVVIDWSSPNDEAPNLYGWGSTWSMKRLIRRPGAPHYFGYLDPEDQMPAFADRLSDADLDAVVGYLKGEFLGGPNDPSRTDRPLEAIFEP